MADVAGLDDSRIVRHPVVRDPREFLAYLSSLDIAVGLAPLGRTVFERSKTDLKFRDLAACGIPGVYSVGTVYDDSVRDGVTGLLVGDDPRAWGEAVNRLFTDASLWQAIRQSAHDDVWTHHSPRVAGAAWVDLLKQVAADPPAPTLPMRGRRGEPAIVMPSCADNADESSRYVARVSELVRTTPLMFDGITVQRVRTIDDVTLTEPHQRLVIDATDAPDDVAQACRDRAEWCGAVVVRREVYATGELDVATHRCCAWTGGQPWIAVVDHSDDTERLSGRTWFAALGAAIDAASGG